MIHFNMQAGTRQLLRQQLILKALGYYNYHLNGIWGTHSIDAMRKFERSDAFIPGRPSGGLPFAESGPYPKGIYKDGDLLNADFLEDKHFHMEQEALSGSKKKDKPEKQQQQAQEKPVEQKHEEVAE